MKSLIEFLRRNRHSVTVISAAAVFAAFLAKDVVREDTKDLLDKIEGAHRDFRFESKILLTNKQINETTELLSTFGSGLFENHNPKRAEQRIFIHIRSAQWKLDSVSQNINNLNYLLGKFSPYTGLFR
jgi:hypothetical protein